MNDFNRTRESLGRVHDLLHEAIANCEMDYALGQRLIERVDTVRMDSSVAADAVTEVARDISSAIAGSIESERDKSNPDAAVIEIDEILKNLKAGSE